MARLNREKKKRETTPILRDESAPSDRFHGSVHLPPAVALLVLSDQYAVEDARRSKKKTEQSG
jgi:hypothetical protein